MGAEKSSLENSLALRPQPQLLFIRHVWDIRRGQKVVCEGVNPAEMMILDCSHFPLSVALLSADFSYHHAVLTQMISSDLGQRPVVAFCYVTSMLFMSHHLLTQALYHLTRSQEERWVHTKSYSVKRETIFT